MPKQKNVKTPPVPKKKPERPFPRRTLQDAIRVPIALKEKNGGNSWSPAQVAAALKVGARTGTFFYITAASRDYGLTEGTRDSEAITLTELGRRVVYPESAESERTAKREAFFRNELFSGVFQHYGGAKLPEKEFLSNVLQTRFGLQPSVQEEFVDVFERNARYLDLESSSQDPIIEPKVDQRGSAVRVVSSPQRGTRSGDAPVCFVIMPFVERDPSHPHGFFAEVLRNLITPAAEAIGFEVRTARRQGSDVIQSTIVNELLQADLVVADLTEHNPNVLFELGMRMAEDKPVALIRAKGTGAIFDVDNMLRVEDYDPCLWPTTLERDLPKLEQHIRGTWENRDRNITFMKLLRHPQSMLTAAVAPA